MAMLFGVYWWQFFSTARVAQHAGYDTRSVICEHCGEATTCHAVHVGTVRCIACEDR